jgi:hypothetical protein
MIADIKGGGLWLGPINTKNKEGNAAGITHELPHLKSTNETFGRSVALKLSSTLTASTKPDRPVGPEDCPKDQNGKYSASCDVNSGGPVLDDSFVDASIEGGGDPLSEPPQLTVQESIAAIIGAARNAVSDGRKDKNGISCADIFNDKAIEFLDAYEKSMSRNGALRFGEKTADGENMKNAYAGTSPFKTAKVNGKDYSIITMNTKNEFFDSDKYDSSALPTGYRHLSFEQFWAVTLLHEIGHAISNSGTKTFIENDAGNVAASIANFKFVVDSCFKAQTK